MQFLVDQMAKLKLKKKCLKGEITKTAVSERPLSVQSFIRSTVEALCAIA